MDAVVVRVRTVVFGRVEMADARSALFAGADNISAVCASVERWDWGRGFVARVLVAVGEVHNGGASSQVR